MISERDTHTTESTEWQLIERVTLRFPCGTETDVGNIDTEPSNDGRKTGKSQKPVEELCADFV